MDELERRLCPALTEMAEEVPPSRDAWAEHQRRLARKSRRDRRRPALMAAAAAAAVALIAVPVLILNARGGGTELTQANTTPPETTRSRTNNTTPPLPGTDPAYEPRPGESVLTQPVIVLSSHVNNANETTYAYTVQRGDAKLLCLAKIGANKAAVIDGSSPDLDARCNPLTPPKANKVVWIQYPVGQGVYVYVASPPTERVLVRRSEGNLIVAYKYASSPVFNVFVAMLGSNRPAAAFTAKDQANQSLEDG
jgi:hypothetical protein